MNLKAKCLLCEEFVETRLFLKVKITDGTQRAGLYRYIICVKCGLVFIHPIPNELDTIYTEEYRTYKDDNISIHEPLIYKNLPFLWKIRIRIESFLVDRKRAVMAFKLNGRILDVGCGIGSFLGEMSKSNWDVYGVEISKYAGQEAANKIGKEKVFIGQLEQCNYDSNYFDVVTCWHVLEHVTNINNLIEEISRIMKDDGLIVIEVPNFDSLLFKLFKENYYGCIYIPEHVTYWSKKSLVNLLNRHGFKIEKIEYPFEAPLTLGRSLMNMLSTSKKNTFMKLCLRIIYLVSIPFSIIYATLASFHCKGEVIRVYAKKF